MEQVFLYHHAGSGNHGCEALVRTIHTLLQEQYHVRLFSEKPQEDFFYDVQEKMEILPARRAYSRWNRAFWKAYFRLQSTGDYVPMDLLPYRNSIRQIRRGDVEISVGGDVYCYEDSRKHMLLHDRICRRGCRTVLMGCSLERDLFRDSAFVEDMKKYDYISARESLTFQMLRNAGLKKVGCRPDSAFILPAEYLGLPDGFQEKNTIGINVSPLVIRKEKRAGIVFLNYVNLVQWILQHTDCSVALIPHVVWKENDDREPLKKLYQMFRDTRRVCMVKDGSCEQLKGYIARCRFFIGARTHASIAAYSAGIPTLVSGYSIKARGIATDLFGTEKHYVVPVQQLSGEYDLTHAFFWIWEHEQEIREELASVLPSYQESAKQIGTDLKKQLGEERKWI